MIANSKPPANETPAGFPAKVLIIDDHVLVRQGMVNFLGGLFPGSECIEARNASEAIEAAQTMKEIELVLLDLLLPGDDGFDLLARLTALLPDAAVAVVSASEDAEHIRRSYDLGIRGYIPKSASRGILRLALPLMLSGETYVPAVALEALRGSSLADPVSAAPAQREGKQLLTPRQKEILALMANGLKNKEIAEKLDMPEGTVKVHVKTILLKFGASNRTHAVIQALRTGLIPANLVETNADWEE